MIMLSDNIIIEL